MERNRLADFAPCLFERVACRYAPWQIGNVRTPVAGPSFDHDCVSHVVRSSVRALRCYRRIRGTADMKEALSNEQLEPLILTIRDQRVILDADLARVYGVSTRVFNQGFKRNQPRFPKDFAFQITAAELDNLRSQFVISSSFWARFPKKFANLEITNCDLKIHS
jgi:ORF6N domain-containing protein